MGVNSSGEVIRLDGFLPYKLILLADRLSRRITSIAREEGDLTLSEWRVMAAVADRPGRTANEVVAITPMDKGVVSRSVRTLIDRGLLRREASDADGRLAHLYLTDAGGSAYEAVASKILLVDRQVREALPEEGYGAIEKGLDEMLRTLR
ncbi:MarR family winged helix-turn-helix transcriptional regulator [Sphingomicrobium lutaoense]|uniref:DNA-binding MarR family transcriptional regulator n=1 Tax=Sphingomicrobium lutaoense TaxID=515949 RepID=A0A839YY76_9SPHN|nr:MarR family transcriptional regulator [Sphingomicrobium lutaoense]MBB3764099.1 DNA-binding MarR family transcriptional regulator [Sphingomicrobium lutaoense]